MEQFIQQPHQLFEALTGMSTIASKHTSEISNMRTNLANEKKLNHKLKGDVANLSDNIISERKSKEKLKGKVSDISSDLAAERTAKRKLKGKIAGLSSDLEVERISLKKTKKKLANSSLIKFRGKKVAVTDAIDMTAKKVSRRVVKTSIRKVGAMAGEALPYVGAAVIVSITAIELKDLCDTIKDMNELKRAFNPELTPGKDETTVCSMKVPSKEELWELAKSSPEKALLIARESIPTLEEIKNYKLPDIDWTGTFNTTIETTGNALTSA
ncbi:hypothetical protein, partial [Candidatus Venteria ishoeyi]|uniref:hypothetical protein n=1 Tax=Candidatus Venteria ishoeyi TaxID=1899563 RepID=UPI0011B088CC